MRPLRLQLPGGFEQQGVAGRRQPFQVAQRVHQRIPVAAPAGRQVEHGPDPQQQCLLVAATVQFDPAHQQAGITRGRGQCGQVVGLDLVHAGLAGIVQADVESGSAHGPAPVAGWNARKLS